MRDTAPIFQGFRVYPRGFLGASLGAHAEASDRPFMSHLQTHQYHPDQFRQAKTPREVNHNVENLWKRVLDQQGVMNSFEFREKVLKVALQAFGTDNFRNWIDVQISGPSTGDMHMDFLRDTLRFIESGQRRMTLHSWTAVLTLSSVDSNITKELPGLNDFFVCQQTKRGKNIKMIDVLQRWCSQEGGFEDLAQTLHVLFGDVKV